jgi:signal transduction histidine kinase
VTVRERLPVVKAHRGAVEQVLANILINAVKFVPPERAPIVTIRSDDTGAMVRLWIEDNGIGIAPEHHDRIFRIFERLHGAEHFAGTGVGLALVRRSVERIGGRVGVESELRRGSRFWIELPKAA